MWCILWRIKAVTVIKNWVIKDKFKTNWPFLLWIQLKKSRGEVRVFYWHSCKSTRLIFIVFGGFLPKMKLAHWDHHLFCCAIERNTTDRSGEKENLEWHLIKKESRSNILHSRQINRLFSTCLCAKRGKKTLQLSSCKLKTHPWRGEWSFILSLQ